MKKFFLVLLLVVFMFGNIKVYALEELVSNGKSALLMEVNSGEIIFEKNKDERLAVFNKNEYIEEVKEKGVKTTGCRF